MFRETERQGKVKSHMERARDTERRERYGAKRQKEANEEKKLKTENQTGRTDRTFAYLKQFSVFAAFPSLTPSKLADVSLLFGLCAKSAFLWVGSKGCLTGLHSDDEENVLAMIRGRKRVTLVPPVLPKVFVC